MLSITDLKTGTTFDMNGDPVVVLGYQHSKMGRSGAVLRTKLRNLKTGATFDITFKSSDKFEEAPLERRSCQYLYAEGNGFVFMDNASFEQLTLSGDVVGEKSRYLKEGSELQIVFYEDKPVSVVFPIKMEFEVVHTEPGVKGDTAQGGSKPATLETGAIITVPLFVKIGDILRVNTDENTYVERANR
ncbi:MAG TPA: elongation factor P [Verrucomicrobiae bacterium]|nr:elongation factor P [Verrucomicrobiae bacterium]